MPATASADATAAATALWASIVGDGNADPVIPERVGAVYAGAAVDLIGVHVGSDTERPGRGAPGVRGRGCGMFLSNTEVTLGWVRRIRRKPIRNWSVKLQSEFHGAALRRVRRRWGCCSRGRPSGRVRYDAVWKLVGSPETASGAGLDPYGLWYAQWSVASLCGRLHAARSGPAIRTRSRRC